jgi:predicted kinase
MKIVGLSGKASSGKTFVANYLAEHYGYTHLALAIPLKNLCKEHFELTDEQVHGKLKEVVDGRYGKSPRQILIDTGRFYRSIDPMFWVKKLRAEILNTLQAQTHIFVISDVRFPNEAAWIRTYGGLNVRLERPIEHRGFELNDESETALDDYDFNLRIPESSNVDLDDIPKIAKRINELLKSI